MSGYGSEPTCKLGVRSVGFEGKSGRDLLGPSLSASGPIPEVMPSDERPTLRSRKTWRERTKKGFRAMFPSTEGSESMEQRFTLNQLATGYKTSRPNYPKSLVDDVLSFASSTLANR
jgi:hypothetical protein